VPLGALLAAAGSLVSDAYRWHPPGPLFLLFAFAVCAMAPETVSATGLGWEHPYWAMVAAVTVLSGPDLASRLTRGLHRVVGTTLGVAVAAPILLWSPDGAGAVLVIVVLQVLTELVVGRNYAVALLFITPLALMMGQLAHAAPTGPLLRDRLLETVLGAGVGAVVLLLIPDRLRRPLP